jgi:hypothetical protein
MADKRNSAADPVALDVETDTLLTGRDDSR